MGLNLNYISGQFPTVIVEDLDLHDARPAQLDGPGVIAVFGVQGRVLVKVGWGVLVVGVRGVLLLSEESHIYIIETCNGSRCHLVHD